jgi:hypothetical protein
VHECCPIETCNIKPNNHMDHNKKFVKMEIGNHLESIMREFKDNRVLE